MLGLEELNINSKDTTKGKHYNKLINNVWNRNKLINNIKKRCDIYSIRVVEMKPNYSSFVGNFLFRDLKLFYLRLMILMIGMLSHWKNLVYLEKSKTWLEYIIS